MLRTVDDALLGFLPGTTSDRPGSEITAASDAAVTVANSHLLFSGEYHRQGLDLVIEDAADRLVIHDYFRPGRRPDLVSRDGASLKGDVVEAISLGDGTFKVAQAGASGGAQQQIGRVDALTGTATAVRNGVLVVLKLGDAVYKGDTVQTERGSTLAVVLLDGSTFSLTASARMVLNDVVYQPGQTGNTSLLSIVQGTVSFVAGQVAKTGEMRVDTPVATMGIRGTAPKIEVQDGYTRFVMMQEPDGRLGVSTLYNKQTGEAIAVLSGGNSAITVTPSGSTGVTVNYDTKGPQEISIERAIISGLFQIFTAAQQNPVNPGQTGPQAPQAPDGQPAAPGTGPGGSAPGSSTPTGNIGGDGSPGTTTRGSPDGNAPPAPPAGTQPTGPTIGSTPTVTLPATGGGGAPSTTTSTTALSALSALVIDIGENDAVTGPGVIPASPGVLAGLYGSLGIKADGTYVYVPLRADFLQAGETAYDTFTYATSDGRNQTVTLRIAGENDAPVAQADTAVLSLRAGPSLAVGNRAAGVLGNDTDVDHDESAQLKVSGVQGHDDGTVKAVADTGTTSARGIYGTLTIAADGTWTYTADDRAKPLPKSQVGTDSFAYTVIDPHGATSTSHLDIAVVGKNDAPVAADDAGGTVQAGGSLSATTRDTGVLGNDIDPDVGETAILKVNSARSLDWPDPYYVEVPFSDDTSLPDFPSFPGSYTSAITVTNVGGLYLFWFDRRPGRVRHAPYPE